MFGRMTIGWIEEFVRDGEAVDGFEEVGEGSRRKLRWSTAALVAMVGAVSGQAILQVLGLYWGNTVVRR